MAMTSRLIIVCLVCLLAGCRHSQPARPSTRPTAVRPDVPNVKALVAVARDWATRNRPEWLWHFEHAPVVRDEGGNWVLTFDRDLGPDVRRTGGLSGYWISKSDSRVVRAGLFE